jgi:hypothetical protein
MADAGYGAVNNCPDIQVITGLFGGVTRCTGLVWHHQRGRGTWESDEVWLRGPAKERTDTRPRNDPPGDDVVPVGYACTVLR